MRAPYDMEPLNLKLGLVKNQHFDYMPENTRNRLIWQGIRLLRFIQLWDVVKKGNDFENLKLMEKRAEL